MRNYVKRVRKNIIVQILFYLFYAITMAFLPYLNKQLFEKIPTEGFGCLIKFASLFLILVVLGEVFCYVSEKYVWKTAIQFEKELKKDFFKAVCHRRHNDFTDRNIGDYISIQSNDITVLEQDFLTPVIDVVKSVIMIGVYGIVIFHFIDLRLGVLLLLQSVIATILPRLMAKGLSEKRKLYMARQESYTNLVREFYENHSLINRETRTNMIRYHNSELEKVSEKRYGFGRFKCVSMSFNGLIIGTIHMTMFLVIGYSLINREISVGTAVAALGYIECFIEPLESLVYDINAINSSKEIRKKMLDILRIDQDERTVIDTFADSICCENVSVTFQEFGLDNFSYTFQKGKKYAIVGPSGAGKSTILKALLGRVKLETGRILVDGVDTSQVDMSKIVTDVGQNEQIFSTSYEENVSLFGTYKTLEDNCVADDYMYLNRVENCSKLSGGEKRIVSYDRMLAENKEIILLDEPFSALDYKTAHKLNEHLMNLEKTVIMITHDVGEESLKNFDKVLLVKDGILCAEGSGREIIEKYAS